MGHSAPRSALARSCGLRPMRKAGREAPPSPLRGVHAAGASRAWSTRDRARARSASTTNARGQRPSRRRRDEPETGRGDRRAAATRPRMEARESQRRRSRSRLVPARGHAEARRHAAERDRERHRTLPRGLLSLSCRCEGAASTPLGSAAPARRRDFPSAGKIADSHLRPL
jgi:hypothetical protein